MDPHALCFHPATATALAPTLLSFKLTNKPTQKGEVQEMVDMAIFHAPQETPMAAAIGDIRSAAGDKKILKLSALITLTDPPYN